MYSYFFIIIIINVIIVIDTALIKCDSVYPVASEDFARLMKYCKGKQQEMESNFKQTAQARNSHNQKTEKETTVEE